MENSIITVFNIYFDDKLLYRKTLTSRWAMGTAQEFTILKLGKIRLKKLSASRVSVTIITPKTIKFLFHLFVIFVYYNL